jgi:hypothetical protein
VPLWDVVPEIYRARAERANSADRRRAGRRDDDRSDISGGGELALPRKAQCMPPLSVSTSHQNRLWALHGSAAVDDLHNSAEKCGMIRTGIVPSKISIGELSRPERWFLHASEL